MKIFLIGFVSSILSAAIISPSQKPEELAYQLAKFYSLSASKEILCERELGETPAPGEEIDYGFFTLKGDMDRLLFHGNPGLKVGSVELNVTEMLTANFSNESERFVATIDASPSTGIFDKGNSFGSLLKFDKGAVVHATKLKCRLK